MTSRYIATQIHKARELAPDDPFLQLCENLPHYIIDDSLLELLIRSSGNKKSLIALNDAGFLHLPFPSMLVEYHIAKKNIRIFTIFKEIEENFEAYMAAIFPDPDRFYRNPAGMLVDIKGGLTGSEKDEVVVYRTEDTPIKWLRSCLSLCQIVLLMSHIQGVEKEVISAPEKLNHQRQARGKPPVPRHSVMRIGHVYDREGRKVAYGSSGRHMPVHMRAGHTRQQHYGKGNSEVKTIYIPPVLVNFKPGDEVRAPQRIIAA